MPSRGETQRSRGCRALVWVAALLAFAAAPARAAEYHGRVLFGGQPVPGATVTVTDSNGKRFSTITGLQGLYQFPDLPAGHGTLHIEMLGFVPLDSAIDVPPSSPPGPAELRLLGLPQILARAQSAPPPERGLTPRPPSTTAAAKSSKAAKTAKAAETSEAPAPAETPPADEAADTARDGFLINGSENNAATSKYSLPPAFGNHRPGTRALYNGSIGAFVSNSVFDARPYSLTGLALPKASYNSVTGVVTLGGPLRIPRLLPHGPNFFLAYQWTRDRDASTLPGLVPTAAQRTGDLSTLLDGQGRPVAVLDPATGLPFTGPVPVSPQAGALLALYPLPNLAGSTRYNYQTQVLNNTHADALQSRLDKSLGRRDELYGGFGFRSLRSDNANLFHLRDATGTLGLDTNINWAHSFPHRLRLTTTYRFSRLRTQLHPNFAGRQNISGDAGITGNDQDPVNWGPPDLLFSSGFAALTDAQSAFNRNRTDALNLSAQYRRGRHVVSFGGDLRRQEFNQFTQANARGAFTFTGAASGSDFADFLLGTPDTSRLATGNPDKYFRQTVYDLFASDDWRLRPELTINAGLRWDYAAPLTELKDRLVNLDLAPDFTRAAPVLASDPVGPLTGIHYPTSLVRPDRLKFQPRLGIAWRPFPASTLVVRAGYGIYVDTSVYLPSTELLAQQAPLSKSLSVSRSSTCPLTLAQGFLDCAGITPNTFAVDPNLRVGYAQIWRLSLQRDLPWALVLNASYLGTKGTRGPQEFLPNTYAPGAPNLCPLCPVGFVYRTSNGNSIRHSGELQLRRRLRSGLTATLDYVYSKSIDNDAELGGGGPVGTSTTAADASAVSTSGNPAIAQNWLDLRAERSRSSFDQRHRLTASFQYTSGTGLRGGTLLTGWRGTLIKQWTASAALTAGTGLPETPVFFTALAGTGVTGNVRPDRTSAPLYTAANGFFLNPAAFAPPVPGQWGNAGRFSVTGPDQFSLDSALARTFRLKDPLNLDIRLDATNLLNRVVFTSWNTVTDSNTYGLPVATNPMRSLQLTARLRF